MRKIRYIMLIMCVLILGNNVYAASTNSRQQLETLAAQFSDKKSENDCQDEMVSNYTRDFIEEIEIQDKETLQSDNTLEEKNRWVETFNEAAPSATLETDTVSLYAMSYYSGSEIPTYTAITGRKLLAMKEYDSSTDYIYAYTLNEYKAYTNYLIDNCGWKYYSHSFSDDDTYAVLILAKGNEWLFVIADFEYGYTVIEVPVGVKKITLNTSSRTMVEGNLFTLKATITPTHATNQKITWSSSNKKVATVTSDGTVCALAAGKATITAKTANGKSATCSIQVKKLVLDYYPNTKIPTFTCITGVNLYDIIEGSGPNIYRYVLDTESFLDYDVYLLKKDGWEEADMEIAEDESYLLISYTKENYILALMADFRDQFAKVAFIKINPVTGVTLNKTNEVLRVGKKLSLIATVAPADATDKSLVWTSSDEAVATVSQEGVVEAKSVGETLIKVTTVDGNKTASCTVTVTAPLTTTTVFFENAGGMPGDTVKVKLSLAAINEINSVAISNFSYDTSIMTFTGFSDYEHIEKLTTLPPTFDEEKMVIMFDLKNAEAFDGDICTLNFRINDNAAEGVYSVTGDPLIKLGSIVLPAEAAPGEVTVRMQLLGDIDGNGMVDIDDAILLFQHSMLPEMYPIPYTGNVDFNKDGNVDIDDAVLLFQYSMLPDLYPLE